MAGTEQPENNQLKGERRIQPKISDFAGLRYPEVFSLPNLASRISEQAIADFCHGCDRLRADNTCAINNPNDQARYVNRNWCGDASVNGKGGVMASAGFKSFSTLYPRSQDRS